MPGFAKFNKRWWGKTVDITPARRHLSQNGYGMMRVCEDDGEDDDDAEEDGDDAADDDDDVDGSGNGNGDNDGDDDGDLFRYVTRAGPPHLQGT